MAVWLVRAGGRGERQSLALDKGMAVIGWDSIPDLSQFSTRESLDIAYRERHPQAKPSQIANWVGQSWAFAKRISVGDVIVLPLKGQDAVALGEAVGPYHYEPNNPEGAKHTRPVRWIATDVPRGRFDKDLLFSFGSLLTVCQIKRNDAENRIRAIMLGKPSVSEKPLADDEIDGTVDTFAASDLGEYAATQISDFIGQKFAGHQLADLVAAVLRAQGYQLQVSEPGPDGGVDIIAGRGPMGFDPPRLCVQVKSGDGQQDVRVVRELKGVMSEFKAEQGLFVAWGGFKRSVLSEARKNFFEIRLWDAGKLVEAVLTHYDQFPAELKADLPLKQIWTLVNDVDDA